MRISDWSSDVCSSDLVSSEERADTRLGRPSQTDRRNEFMPQKVRGVIARSKGAPVEMETVIIPDPGQIGRASCRERVCQYVSISVVAVALKTKTTARSGKKHTQ